MSGFFKFLIHSFFSSWHCNKTETAQSSVYDIQNKGNQLEILLFPCSLWNASEKKSNIRQMLLQRQQHSLFPLKEKKNQNIISPSTSRLCQELTARLFPFFAIEKVTVILFVKKDAVPTQTTAPVQDSHIQHSCRHQVSYLWLQAVSLNKYGADIPVLVYNFNCPLHKTMDYWFKIEF